MSVGRRCKVQIPWIIQCFNVLQIFTTPNVLQLSIAPGNYAGNHGKCCSKFSLIHGRYCLSTLNEDYFPDSWVEYRDRRWSKRSVNCCWTSHAELVQMAFLTRRVAIGARDSCLFKFPAVSARWNSSGPSVQRDNFESLGAPTTEPTPQQVPTEKFEGHHMLSPFTAGWQSKDMRPLIIDRSEGVFVYDKNGKKYLDALAGLWCNALGGHEPRLVAAATAQLNKLPFYHSFWNRTTQPSLDLAKCVLEIFKQKEMGKVFFTNSGSESNDTQVKLVWYYNNALGRPNKKKIIAHQKAYHGSTLVSASLSGLTNLHQSFDLPLPFVRHTDCPHYWRYHLPGETEEEFATRLAGNLEKLILKEGPETIAAFIAEPVMGAGGVILPPETYFEKVQAVVKKYDILFIADEVICGFGRLGTMFGCEKYNIKPDLVSIAKALSSAYMPIAGVLVSQEIADVILSESNKYGSFAHGFTYSGHPVSCAVALEALKIYKERNIIEHVQCVAPVFQAGMKSLAASPIIGEIRGTGLVVGVEFTDNKSPEAVFPPEWAIGAYVASQCVERGMLVRVAGDSIMLSPPLIITPEEIQQIIKIFEEALKSTEERVKYLKCQENK